MSDNKNSELLKAIEKKDNKLKAAKTVESTGFTQAKLLHSLKATPKLQQAGKPDEGLSSATFQQYMLDQRAKAAASGDKKHLSFTEALDPESLERFNEVAKRKFSEQAVFFLNAFWDECGKFAELVYTVYWDILKDVDMHRKNVHYVHLYEEGKDLDFDMGLRFFELLNEFFKGKGQAYAKQFPEGVPAVLTAIVRKKELRDTVDVNFDGRVGFLEFLLYQFKVSPKVLMDRSVVVGPVNEALVKAQKALDDVSNQIKSYETEKKRLEDLSMGTGVKAMGAKNLLAQLTSSPLMDKLRALMITAEAAVRAASKLGGATNADGKMLGKSEGTIWWMNRVLQSQKEKYGKK